MNDYMIFCGHYKTMTCAVNLEAALEYAKTHFKPKKNQSTGAWRMIKKHGGFQYCQVQA
jgi:hypothetical protein